MLDEYKKLRTVHSKTYLIDRTHKKLVISLRPLHFWNEDHFQEIDLTPKETEKGWKLKTPEYKCEIIKFPFEIKFNKHSIRNIDSPDTTGAEIKDNTIYFPRLDWTIYFRPNGIEVFKPEKESGWIMNGNLIKESDKRFPRFDTKRIWKTSDIDEIITLTKTANQIRGKTISREIVKRKTLSKDPEDRITVEIIYEHQAW